MSFVELERKVPAFPTSEGDSFTRSPTEIVFPEQRAGVLQNKRKLRCLCCCACTIFLPLVSVYFFAVHYVTALAIDEMLLIEDDISRQYCTSDLAMSNLTWNIQWPGCPNKHSMSEFSTECGLPCYPASLMQKLEEFNKKYPGKRVSYNSRVQENVETVTLTGWWLPAPSTSTGNPTPRVVLQHGFQANSNKFRTVLAAYMLRSMGVSVLVNNLRDHGYSARSKAHTYEWGHAYPYDLLGAWDYARSDPDGLLGGARTADQVGVFGFSMGAFLTVDAFGIEPNIPFAWVDSPPYRPSSVFKFRCKAQLDGMGLGALQWMLEPLVWRNVEKAALAKGVDLDKWVPENALPLGPDSRRSIFVVASRDDDWVPVSEHDLLMALLARYPEKYAVQSWVTDGNCFEKLHVISHLNHFDTYLDKLCKFMKTSFGFSNADVSQCSQLAAASSTLNRASNSILRQV